MIKIAMRPKNPGKNEQSELLKEIVHQINLYDATDLDQY